MYVNQENFGYDKERFVDLKTEIFDCVICCLVVKNPKECNKCGSMFCSVCIDEWIAKKNQCPNRCFDPHTSIKPIGGALYKLYRNLDIQCRFPGCKTSVKLCEIEAHEQLCQVPKCYNYEQCKQHINIRNERLKDEQVCDEHCLLLKKFKESKGNWDETLTQIKAYSYELDNIRSAKRTMQPKLGVTTFRWDSVNIGKNIKLNQERTDVFLKEPSYVFRTVIAETPFYGGCHYWEITADSRTENEMKIGITLSRDFDLDTAFSDYDFGFCYYGLGQLRHKSNSLGITYGKKFKKQGKLGVFLDMIKGTLSFAFEDEYWGIAYKNEKFKTGPIWPAISLLHQAGCSLANDIEVPHCFIS